MNRIALHWKENKSIWFYIFLLFFVSRIIISAIGLLTFHYQHVPVSMLPWRSDIYKEHPYLAQWTVWDSDWYLDIAKYGYRVSIPFNPSVIQNVGFFPLYPLSVGILGFIIRDYVVAGVLLSNVYLILACFFLYKLVRMDWDEQDARRTLFYLFLFPTAYIFSALYAESLLLLLFILSIYAARKEKWFLASAFGFLAALTKPTGFILALPLLLMYLQTKNWSLKKIRWNILFIGLVPLGILSFAVFTYFITGDLLAYPHVQHLAWHHNGMNPVVGLYISIFGGSFDTAVTGIGCAIALLVLCLGIKKIPIGYWAFALALMIFPLSNDYIVGALRYLVVIFPLTMVLAAFGRNEKADRAIIISMALLQGAFIVFWTANYWFIS